MPIVKLLSYTGIGHHDPLFAAKLLAFTKNTRLQMTPDGFDDFLKKPEVEIIKELEYMAGTIPSSWEMVSLVFSIEKLSRATAQQVTRTRNASYAMQSMRVTDMSEVTYDVPPTASDAFIDRMELIKDHYTGEVEMGTSLEDARDLLPIGVHSNLIAKYNLRALVELVQKRTSLRVQGPYVSIVDKMKAETLKVWPWAETFFRPKNQRAIEMIEAVAKSLKQEGDGDLHQLATQLAKAADLLKGE